MASTGGQDEAILCSVNLPYAKFNSSISSVCYLALLNGSNVERQATGFLARFSLHGSHKMVVVMNNHFVSSEEDASKVEATFKFEGRAEIKHAKLDPEIFFTTNKDLDYTFVGISQEHVNDLREHDVSPMKLEQTRLAVQPNDVIHIPQHPGGKSKRISYSTIYKITNSEVFYKADTSSGSSGSPVLCCVNDNMHVLALHKSGGVLLDGILTNRGMLISAILAHICPKDDNDEKPEDVHEGVYCGEKRESGMYVEGPTTTEGLPVVQAQSGQSVPNNNPGTSCDKKEPFLAKETEHPSSITSGLSPPLVKAPPQVSQADAVSSRSFEPKELIRIAHRIGDVWAKVAKYLNFKDHEVANIRVNSSLSDPTMKADRMLTSFKSRLGKREDLANAIREVGKYDLADNVRLAFYIDKTD